MRTCRRVWAGLGTLPGYGPHPGIPIVGQLSVIAALFGAVHGSWRMAVVAVALMNAVLGPMLCYGAWERARDYEREQSEARTDRAG